MDKQIALWTARAADLQRRTEAGKGESSRAWKQAQRIAKQIVELRAGPLDKRLLEKFMTKVDELCYLVTAGADREQAWAEQEKCTVMLQRLERERRTAQRENQERVRDLLRLRLIDRDEAKRRLAVV